MRHGLDVGWRERISVSPAPDVSAADIVIEAVVEDLEVKRRTIALAQERFEDAPVWSTTSAILPSELALGAPRADGIIVAHFINPAHLIPLVEVVSSNQTSQRVVDQCMEMLRSWGKRPVLLSREIRGFVHNRLQYALFREALSLVDSGVVEASELDALVRSGFGLRMPAIGPFGLANLAGPSLYATIADCLWPDLDNSTSSLPMHELAESGKRFMGWSEDDVRAAAQEVRVELITHVGNSNRRPS